MVIIIMVLVSIGVGWLDDYWSNFVVLISVLLSCSQYLSVGDNILCCCFL